MSMMILHRRIELRFMLAAVVGMVMGRCWGGLRRTRIWILRLIRSVRGMVRCRMW